MGASGLRDSKKPIVFYANGIGDSVLVTPALRALGLAFQGRAKFIFKDGADRFLFSEYGRVDAFFIQMRVNRERNGRIFSVNELQDYVGDCDLFLCFADWLSSSLLDLQNYCAATSAGFFSNFDLCLPRLPSSHQFDTMFSISKAIFPELRIEMFSSPPKFSLAVQGVGDDILLTLGKRPCIGLHPESSTLDKSYPNDSVCAFIHFLLKTRDTMICIFGQSDTYSSFEGISERVVVFNCIPLELASYLISRMSLFVGVDSCFLHMADLCRVPTVGLFGPTDPTVWGCRFTPHVHVRASTINKINAMAVAAAVRSLADICQIII